MTTHTSILRTPAIAFVSAALLLGACGGDDDDTTTVDTPAGEVEVDPSDIDTGALQDAVDEDGNLDIDAVIDATGLSTKGTALKSAMSAESFEVDGTTLRLVFDKDGVESAPLMDCMIVGAIVDETDTVVLVYNDGEHTCE